MKTACPLAYACFPKKQKRPPIKKPRLKIKKKTAREKVYPRLKHRANYMNRSAAHSGRRFLRIWSTATSFGGSSRVRASAKSARCPPASPSKVDRTDEAALRYRKQTETFPNDYQKSAGSETPGRRQKTKMHRHLRGGRKIRRPWAANARIVVGFTQGNEDLSSRSRSQNDQPV